MNSHLTENHPSIEAVKDILRENSPKYVPYEVLSEKGILETYDGKSFRLPEDVFNRASYQIKMELLNILYDREKGVVVIKEILDGDLESHDVKIETESISGQAYMILSLYNSYPSSFSGTISLQGLDRVIVSNAHGLIEKASD